MKQTFPRPPVVAVLNSNDGHVELLRHVLEHAGFVTVTPPPVSMPIAWADLEPTLKPDRFTVKSTPAHLARRRVDPWLDYWSSNSRRT